MAVFEVIMWEVKPGRDEEFLALARDLKGILQRIDTGLESVSASRAMIAGQNSGRVTMRFEYTDLAAWSASIETELKDPDIQALVKQMGTDPPATIVNRVLATDIPL